jgi:hypothetical protein
VIDLSEDTLTPGTAVQTRAVKESAFNKIVGNDNYGPVKVFVTYDSVDYTAVTNVVDNNTIEAVVPVLGDAGAITAFAVLRIYINSQSGSHKVMALLTVTELASGE